MDIKDLIKKRCFYLFSSSMKDKKDEWIEEALISDEKDVYLVLPEVELFLQSWKNVRDMIRKNYYFHGVYQLGSVFQNTMIKLALIHLSKDESQNVMIGIFNGPVYDKKDTKFIKEKMSTGEEFLLPEKYSDVFQEYISYIESWENKRIYIEVAKNDVMELKSISMNEFEVDKCYPHYYTEKAIAVRRFLSNEKIVRLKNVADIFMPHPNRDKAIQGKRITIPDLKYPFESNKVQVKNVSNVVLQKNDIIIPTISTKREIPYLFPGCEEEIYASWNMAVIRCKDILPEYLCLYLFSDTAQQVMDSLPSGATLNRITGATLREMPVILPTLSEQKYKLDYMILIGENVRHYGTPQANRLYSYLEKVNENTKIEEVEKVEDILNIELAHKIKMHNTEQLSVFLSGDLAELNTCFRGKAYKATLILAGSILEAVLIDWLSELHHKNYFEEDYEITDRNGRAKRADLIDYINEIKYIEKPNWMEEASKAHEIRKKRNLVHAKLCLKSDEINEAVCREVIGYLEDVIKTRGVEQ